MKVFLIAGKAETGKNVVAEIIKEYYQNKGEESVITGITKYIKMYAGEISNWKGDEENKPRELLQMIGTRVREELGEKFFVRRIVEDLSFYKLNYENVIISDVRLPFEIEYFREVLGDMAIALRIKRVNHEDSLKEEERLHETETALDSFNRFDYEIINDNIVELKKDIIKILEGID